MSSCGCLRLVLAKLVDRRASSCHHHCMCLDRSVSSYDRHCIALAELLDRSMPSCIVCHHCIVLVQLLEKSASSCHRHCMCLDRSVSSFCHHCIALAQLLNRGVPSCYHHSFTLAQLLDRCAVLKSRAVWLPPLHCACTVVGQNCITLPPAVRVLAQLLDRTASPCHQQCVCLHSYGKCMFCCCRHQDDRAARGGDEGVCGTECRSENDFPEGTS